MALGEVVTLDGNTAMDVVSPDDAGKILTSNGVGAQPAFKHLQILTADPGSPVDDTWWAVRTGATPTMSVAVKARIAGATYTIAEITL